MPSETIDSTKQFEFQISDWNSYHELDQEEEEKYVIQLFGRTEDDHDVCLKVTGYTPFFYVEIPKQWKQRQVDKFVEILKNKVQYHCKKNLDEDFDLSKSLIKYAMVKKHKFYNFRNKQLYNFLLLVFKSHTAMKEFSSILARPLEAKGLTNKPMLYQRYESNIEPHIRFMHINNLSSCGWASIDKDKLKKIPEYSNCDYSFSVNWKDVKPSNNDDRMAPFKIMGYDIECVSCDQNFPQAERPSDKIIQIGITMYRYGSMKCYEQHILTLKKCAPIEGVNVECYKKEKGLLRGFAKKIAELRPDFKTGYNNFGFDDKYIYDRILRIDKREGKKQGVNINALKNKFMDEILRTIGKVNNNYLIENEGLDRIPIYITVKDKKLSSKANRFIQTRGGTYVENGNNLKYVQSPGITYFEVKNLSSSALGDNELKFIQIPGVLSIDMMKVIQRDHRLIGYKLDNVSANFITEKADKIIEMPHNQEDSDSEKEDEDTDDKTYDVNIYTKSTKALEKDSYIQIMVNDGYSSSPLSEGAKYKVYDIQTITEKKLNEKTNKEEIFVYQAIKTKICQKDIQQLRETIKNPLLGISWTFAKDDMHHTKINEYFEEGDPKKIRQIAKYCLKDCKLVNLLLAKLEIIVNSVGMAKVCHVPLSYLFLRGQGVKIFSLVSKKCREKNFLIPVLRRKSKDNEGDEDETYEGATVITPKPNVYLSPIGVLDYSSLYPNSMRERNLSQECYVDDSKYDNLPGYIYHDVEIILKDKKGKILRNIDGTPQKEYHRFAQEIITDEQINRELKDIFDKINTVFENNVAIIQNQKYFTEKNISELIDKHKNISDSKIEDIEFDESLSDKRKNKLVDAEKDSLDKNIGFYQKIKSQIDKIKLDSKIEIDNLSKNLDEEEKSKQINKMELNTKNLISKVFSKYLITEQQREELIVLEKERAKRSVNAEKAKVYNTVDGITVRYGILPEILTELLNKRKETNGKLANEKDPFVKAILNALQLAFKVTANSLYGQTGAPTSPLYFIAIAACTTAIGRERLHYAKKTVEDNFPGSEVIYGDTDSIFINFHIKDENGEEKTDKEALMKTIAKCQRAAKLINQNVPKPQSIVYEKTLHPFILVAKKKYVGLLFEKSPDKYFLKSMGIVLKRRDNAPIVKIVVGGIIDNILKNRDIDKAIEYTKIVLDKLMNGEYPMDKFIISKTLKSRYKKPSTIAHKVLADRMAVRDPGNKPQINDRIPFVYIVKDMGKKKKKDILQGDLIEHPEYVIANNLKIDYLYYLEHQIINPASQILELMMDTKDVQKFFNKYIIDEQNKRKGAQSLTKWMDFSKLPKESGSKTAKKPYQSQKLQKTKSSNKSQIDPKYINLIKNKSRKHECQNMNKWISSTDKCTDDWEPIVE
ncbi:B-family DNA polymerase [Acanthamoeba polyphaga mimivirus]|nr:B-family DNA polymerase [Mimivirus reunion]WMV61677.1 B-family DNA polymerase [Mimivirus sp.]WMV62654.1 B-family DNA polymerase [Acanthamoeba polyphaga mimivirus]WMV63631.1 B-family DNA polymerase [Mimivirus sp.]